MLTRIFFLVIVFSSRLLMAQAQTGIGTSNPHSSAVLDISSSSKGFLVPRMSQAARLAINSPSNGLLVYDSTQHRLYQVQDGVWRYMLTNAEWSQSSTHNWTYNSTDSIGLGLSTPTEKLDVNGDISANNFKADNNIVAGGNIVVSSFASPGNIIVTGNASAAGTVTTYSDINLDDASPIVQLQNSSVKEAFFQASGNDLRFGTNSGNSTGKIILRMNGDDDVISIDRNANITLPQNSVNSGNIAIGWKVCRFSKPDINMLPVLFGLVPANGGGAGWISPFGSASWSKVATGKYEITSILGITPYSAIIATPSEAGRICTATYVSPGLLRIETFTRNGTPVDCSFTYTVNDPLN